MIGSVDSQGRALLPISIRRTQDTPEAAVNVWVDTGFNGDLVLPKRLIKGLGLTRSDVIQTTLADGREVRIASYIAWLDWFGECIEVEVCASEGENVLLGVFLMLGRRLIVDYAEMTLSLE